MNVLILVLEDFPGGDTRVRRQVAALVDRGHSVTVMCASAYSDEAEWYGAKIVRTIVHRRKSGGVKRRFLEYLLFVCESAIRILVHGMKRRIDLVQVANMPDFLVVAALPARLLRKFPIVLDMHDLMPELMVSKKGNSVTRKALLLQERLGVALATTVMTVNSICAGILKNRHQRPIEVIPNCPDAKTFLRSAPRREPSPEHFVIGYHGTVADRFGVLILIRAVASLINQGRRICLEVWGGGLGLCDAIEVARSLGIDNVIRFHGQTPVDELIEGLQNIDVSVVPYNADPYMGIAYSTKAFESAILGIPLVLSDLPGVREQFDDSAALFFEPGNHKDLARKLAEVIDKPDEADRRVAKATERMALFDWNVVSDHYVGVLIESLSKRSV